jgi:hypothetical protein
VRTVVLVGCSKRKANRPGPARSFYLGELFSKSVAWAEASGLEWAVLSTKYGLVSPGERVEPYSCTLSRAPAVQEEGMEPHRPAREWAASTGAQLRAAFPGARFVSLLSAPYEAALDGLDYESPLRGMSLGQRLRFLKSELEKKERTLWTP